MRVSGFMVPADKVYTVDPKDTIEKAMDLLLQHEISAIVVMDEPEESFHTLPRGIITKTDLIQAYHDRKSVRTPVQEILNLKIHGDLKTCTDTMNRDEAAKILEHNKIHHALVVDHNDPKRFMGILSTWDITAECARDDRAWPWNRHEDGHFHRPGEEPVVMGTSPTSATHMTDPREQHHKMGDSFRRYVDDLAEGATPYFGD